MYSNRFTQNNPGLIMFLVDQSGSTEDMMSNGFSLAENIADLVNNTITDVIAAATVNIGDEESKVKHEVCIEIIGYGGKGNPYDEKDPLNWNAELLTGATFIDDLENQYNTEESKISGIFIKSILQPTHGGGTPMADAFRLALDELKAWNQSHDTDKDPVPIIINISDGEPTDDKQELKKVVEEIKQLKTADGSPLIINMHLSANPSSKELKTPASQDECYDEFSKLMFDISTEVTDDLAKNNMGIKNLKIQTGSKLFCSNINNFDYAAKFLAVGTLQKIR